jgi:hypothetical protein
MATQLAKTEQQIVEALFWRRGWDSNRCRLLKTKNFREFGFRTIRAIRTKALVETRIEHAELAVDAGIPSQNLELGAGRGFDSCLGHNKNQQLAAIAQ